MLHEYKENPTERLHGEISEIRIKVRKEIDTWREYQMERIPGLLSLLNDKHLESPEDEPLLLPSDFDMAERRKFNMVELATTELELWHGMANDALQGLRLAIKTISRDIQFKRKEVFGQHENTRANSILRTKFLQRNHYATLYRKARLAMIQLGLPANDSNYKDLKEEDIHVKSLLKAHELGSGTTHDSWIGQHISGVRLNSSDKQSWENDSKSYSQ
ncbi:MAG TPA: hypothetical protein VGO47_06585 [Chlamydiales bacterium]|nr:hypothetical protein [Chlamydiales bacterium]